MSQNGLFLSAANMRNGDGPWSFWVNGDLRQYLGDNEGNVSQSTKDCGISVIWRGDFQSRNSTKKN